MPSSLDEPYSTKQAAKMRRVRHVASRRNQGEERRYPQHDPQEGLSFDRQDEIHVYGLIPHQHGKHGEQSPHTSRSSHNICPIHLREGHHQDCLKNSAQQPAAEKRNRKSISTDGVIHMSPDHPDDQTIDHDM